MTKKIKVGKVYIGGGEKIAIQSMSVFRPKDTDSAVAEALRLKAAGCDILRFCVKTEEDALALKKIKDRVDIPLVADIHFDYRLAVLSAENGADKIRINPGNIGGEDKIKIVADALKRARIPVRVGSNTGSVEKEFLEKYGKSDKALAESALKRAAAFEKYGVSDICISVKASAVPLCVAANEYVHKKSDYPLHLGVTEAGTEYGGLIKNSVGIGAMLLRGIGDTLRVSLSADPVKEVRAAKEILKSVGLFDGGAELVACPTCGRCEWDCMGFAKKTEDYLDKVGYNVKVAVMGCAVNGPGEAKDADIGIAGAGNGECVIFYKGDIIKRVTEENAEKEFFAEIERFSKER